MRNLDRDQRNGPMDAGAERKTPRQQPTSATGQKATFPHLWRISALPQKADIDCFALVGQHKNFLRRVFGPEPSREFWPPPPPSARAAKAPLAPGLQWPSLYRAFFSTISNPLACNSFRMLFAKWEHSSGLIQHELLQSGSSSLEYVLKADRIPASIASVASTCISASSGFSINCMAKSASTAQPKARPARSKASSFAPLFAFPVEQEIHPLTKTNCRYAY